MLPLSLSFSLVDRQDAEARRSAEGKRPGPNATWPLEPLRADQIAGYGAYLYAPFFCGGGITSLCCAQAPSPKAVTRTATIMILFNSFNLSRLLSQQVAPVCLGREEQGSNAFSYFF